jgi:hypothetical protein
MTASEKSSGDHAAPDDVKRKFREALERKTGKTATPEGEAREAVVHAHTGPAKTQRQFRRKSGG